MDIPEDFELPPKKQEIYETRQQLEARREKALKTAKREAAVVLAETGLRASEAALVLGTTTDNVKHWLAQYEKDPESFSQKTRRMKLAMMDQAAMALFELKQRIESGKMKDIAVVAALKTLTSEAKELNNVQEEEAKPDWGAVQL